MASRTARPSRLSRQRKQKSTNSAHPGGASTGSLKIGEAARVLGVEAYVLRFWETQFPELRPYHTATKHRLYSGQDIETLRLIKHLLYDEGFTIEGARKRIKELAQSPTRGKSGGGPNSSTARAAKMQAPAFKPAANHPPAARQALIDIRRDLESIYQLLKN